LDAELTTIWVVASFILFLIIFANLSPKKLDRYIMAVIPALIFLSAIGLSKTMPRNREVEGQRNNFSPAPLLSRSPAVSLVVLAGLVALHLASALFAAPYYLTYYNPLLGGPREAVAQVPVGWGEGLEQAAHYLNGLPEASSLAVSAWYSDIFQPYFAGQRASFSDDGRAQLAADYVVFYANQIQRQKPYAGLINYFRAGEPAFVLYIGQLGQVSGRGGAPWVEVYHAPAAQSAGGAPKIEGVAQLLAYKVAGGRVTGGKAVEDGYSLSSSEVLVTLFLRVLGPIPKDSQFKVALSSPQNPPGSIWQPAQMKGEWLEGAVVEWPGTISLPGDLPAGDYRLVVALQAGDGSPMAEFAISEKDPPIKLKASK
jgi:hypothetical protein